MNFKELNKKLVEALDYDSWLSKQTDDYIEPRYNEITFTGISFFDVKAKKPDGEIVELKNVPLDYSYTANVAEENPYTGQEYAVTWDKIEDNLEDYVLLKDVNLFDTYAEGYEDQLLPEDWQLVEVLRFSDGHDVSDLEVE